MEKHGLRPGAPAPPTRRTFVKGLAIGSAAASLGWLRQPLAAQTPRRATAEVLTGTEFDLRIGETAGQRHRRDRVRR